ncbi:hypothetical protein GF380_02445, partial [Candidatus Uhrbacteria bacterium]|nr:hypothetical protein [Candidatus Uhrbacteria bacterium]MBD3284051.1 hypothetical protein [Candidatus Uhrbacteria bacterium]
MPEQRSKSIVLFASIIGVLIFSGLLYRQLIRSETNNPQPLPAMTAQQAGTTHNEILEEPHKAESLEPELELYQPSRVPLPDEVRGIYWTAVTAGTSRGDELLAYMKETGINAVVIDLKLDNGEIAFEPINETLKPFAQETPAIKDLEALMEKLAEAGIYRIARLAVMRDDTHATIHPENALKWKDGGLWQDKIGSYWMDPAGPFVAEYAVTLAKEAYQRGFDEIQYDYIR